MEKYSLILFIHEMSPTTEKLILHNTCILNNPVFMTIIRFITSAEKRGN